MINTQLKSKGKIDTVQTLLNSQGITQNYHVQGKFDLQGQGQNHQYSNQYSKPVNQDAR